MLRTRTFSSWLLLPALLVTGCARPETAAPAELGQTQAAVTAACDPATGTCCPSSGFTERVLTAGADTLSSSTADLCVRALDGADTLMLGPHAYVIGGPGNDTINAWNNSTVVPGEGADTVSVSGASTVIINDLCETTQGKTLFGGGDGTLVTPVPLADLRTHITVSGFAKIVVKSNACHAACVPGPVCSGHGSCAEGAAPGQVDCVCEPGHIGQHCELPGTELEHCAATIPLPPASLPATEREQRYQADIARFCSGPRLSRCQATLAGRANVDYKAAAMRLGSQTFSPAQYLAAVRDRTRKLRLSEDDIAYQTALCAQPDADGDWVVDGRDRCPGTPDLVATDDNGCPLSPLPPAPSAADVKTVLDGMGMLLNLNCSGSAPPPSLASGAFFLGGRPEDGTFIFASRARDQRPGCPVFYQFDVQLLDRQGRSSEIMVLYVDKEAEPKLLGLQADVPPDYIQFRARPTDPGARGILGSVPTKQGVRFRVRAMNGNGARGPWSEWRKSTSADCAPLGLNCG